MKIVECSRDAMQGWEHFIPTEKKIAYHNQLLKVGFDILDVGSFVSPKAIPQMADTKEVIPKLDLSTTKTELLAIVANNRGALDAVGYDEIKYLGFPFSISETFQQKNTNSSIEESLSRVSEIQELCIKHNKKMVIYISMGFGNPYGDEYSADLAIGWVQKLVKMDIGIFQMSDTVGVSNPDNINYIFSHLNKAFPSETGLTFGAHFHSTEETRLEKLGAALKAGCESFDGAIMGIGGCPMAQNDLVGNMATETTLHFLMEAGYELNLDMNAFIEAQRMAGEVFV